jgi:hypothetical protein
MTVPLVFAIFLSAISTLPQHLSHLGSIERVTGEPFQSLKRDENGAFVKKQLTRNQLFPQGKAVRNTGFDTEFFMCGLTGASWS